MKEITEADSKELIDAWFAEAETQTLASLPVFIGRLCDDYRHDYGTVCHAIAAAAVGAAWAVNDSKAAQGGITGFQAGAVMWEFMRRWNRIECPARLVRYEEMLWPQYAYVFEKTISREVMDWLVAKAKEYLADASERMVPEVRQHMESIASGTPPFGYTVRPE